MKRLKGFGKIPALAVLMLFISCVNDQNFESVVDVSDHPSIEGNLIALESYEKSINKIAANDSISQEYRWDDILPVEASKQLLDGMLRYQIENTTSKELLIEVQFLDLAGMELDSESFLLPAAPTGILNREVTYGTASGKNIDILRNSESIRVTVLNLGDRKTVSVLVDPKISFNSSGTFKVTSN